MAVARTRGDVHARICAFARDASVGGDPTGVVATGQADGRARIDLRLRAAVRGLAGLGRIPSRGVIDVRVARGVADERLPQSVRPGPIGARLRHPRAARDQTVVGAASQGRGCLRHRAAEEAHHRERRHQAAAVHHRRRRDHASSRAGRSPQTARAPPPSRGG